MDIPPFDLSADFAKQVALAKLIYQKLEDGEGEPSFLNSQTIFTAEGGMLSAAALDFALDGITSSGFRYGYRRPGSQPPRFFKDWALYRLREPLSGGYRTHVPRDRRHLYTRDEEMGIYTPLQEQA